MHVWELRRPWRRPGKRELKWARALPAAVTAVLLVACNSTPAATPTTAPTAVPKPAAATSAPAAPASAASPAVASSAVPASSPAAAAASSPIASASNVPVVATPPLASTANGTPIKIGYMADSNGTSAPIAAGMHLATDLAVQEVNAAGGINGHPIQIEYVDPQSDPTQAVQMATQLAQTDNVDIIMGGVLSSECLAVQQLVGKLQVVYVPTFGCAAEEFSSQSCNKYSFRFYPVGSQELGPLVSYIVKTYGPNYAMMYSDYAYGQSQLNAYQTSLQKVGGKITVPIPVPQNEPNLAPYVTKVPTDGSVSGVIISGLGAGDLTRVSLTLGQYGVNQKVQIIGNSLKDVYGGTYPDFVNGSVNVQTYIPGQPPNNTYGAAFEKAFRNVAAQEPDWANILGGANIIEAAEGYPQYSTIKAVFSAMKASNFTGRKDTDALITALENVNLPLGPDSPGGGTLMHKSDHQGTQPVYVYKIDGQNQDVLATISADQVPPVGSCQV